MGKTVLYIAVLGIFGFGVWYFLFNDKSVFEDEEAGFTISDTSRIHKIFLASKKGDTISLKRTPEGWMVNDKYMASRRMTQTLLATMHYQFAAYPVPEVAHNNVIRALAGSGIKTEVFDKDGDIIRTFYVGGQATGGQGTYMLVEGAERPYIVQLPINLAYLTPRYSTDLAMWRDRTAIDLKAEELKRVAVNYAASDEYLNSFTMVREDNGELTVETHPELNLPGEPNKRRVKAFAGYFEKVGFEGYLNGVTRLDSIIANTDKRVDIDITTMSGETQHIDIYWMPVNKRSKNLSTPDPEIPDEYDPDRFYGVMNNFKDTVILQRYTFDRFFRKGYEFYEKDAEQ